MRNVILSAIVVLICASCSNNQNKISTAKVVVKDSVYKKDSNVKSALSNTACENCPDKNNPPVWYIWDSKRFFW